MITVSTYEGLTGRSIDRTPRHGCYPGLDRPCLENPSRQFWRRTRPLYRRGTHHRFFHARKCLSSAFQLGGTVGDIESAPFIEAMRQFQFRVGHDNFALVHVSLVPDMHGEQKTKPTQTTVHALRGLGLLPDLVSRTFRGVSTYSAKLTYHRSPVDCWDPSRWKKRPRRKSPCFVTLRPSK